VPPGIVLRTDYSVGSDEAWDAFCSALRDAEREFFSADWPSAPGPTPTRNDGDSEMAPVSSLPNTDANDEEREREQEDESDEESEEDDEQVILFTFVSDPARLSDISNLRALRLLFDVSVRTAPASALGTEPHRQHPSRQQLLQQQPRHRLTGLRGLQETYDAHGRTLWIFDVHSRTDGCTRLVSDAGYVAT
jgi:hypothetical protein